MNTFGSLMDYVDEELMMAQSNPHTLSRLYLSQIRENPYSRWFVYDVTRNHLRYLLECRNYNIEFMNNRRGPRWAFYPAIMTMIDQLIADGYISIVSLEEYQDDPIYFNSESIGLISYYENSMKDDDKLEYLDIRIEDRWQVALNLTHPNLIHLHILLGDGIDLNVSISESIKYLSFNVDPSLLRGRFNVKLRAPNVNLIYLQIYHCISGDVNIVGEDSELSMFESLINPYIKYIDIATLGYPYRTIREIRRRLFDIHDGQQWPQLSHFGFKIIPTGNEYYDQYKSLSINTFTELSKYLVRFHKLTSLSVPVLNSHMSGVNRLSEQLVHLELHYVRYIYSAILMPSRLKHIRTLHLSFPTSQENHINFKMGRWNLPDTCNILSFYTEYCINTFNTNFDLLNFKNLKYLMVKYHENVTNIWIVPILFSNILISIIDYPSSPEDIIQEYAYIVVWEYSIPLMVLSKDQLIELYEDQVVRYTYNTHAFMKQILNYQ